MKVTISRAAKILGVSTVTLRRWEAVGKITSERTATGHRRYDLSMLHGGKKFPDAVVTQKTMGYARVSSHDQRDDLSRQVQMLEMFCVARGWTYEIISDLGSGMNYKKRGLKRLLDAIDKREINRLVLTHKDRLLRFGAELIFSLCEARRVEVVVMNQGDEATFEEELAQDVLEIITVFSARLYGSRSQKNRKLIADLKVATEAVNA